MLCILYLQISKMFYIVEFISTADIAVIPSLWRLEHDVAVWPPYHSNSRIEKAVKNEESPGADWIRYSVRVIYNAGKI